MKYSFDALKARDEAIKWIRDTADNNGFTKTVLGISGGKDSTIAAALCCRALGAENVHGLLLPNGMQSDINDSIDVCKALGIEYDTINIKPIYDAHVMQYVMCTSKQSLDTKTETATDGNTEDMLRKILAGAENEVYAAPSKEALFNLPPRIRTAMIRLWGQSNHHRMCGTGNLSEITVGYCTKDGDTSNDFNPLGGLTSIEVVEVGKLLTEIPTKYVVKTPSDGLTGMSDEEKLGVSYINIHSYIRGLDMVNEEWYKINKMEKMGMHKRAKTVFIPSSGVLGV